MTTEASGRVAASARSIRHFHHLDHDERSRLFVVEPEPLSDESDRELLALALGATLYMPGDMPDLATKALRRSAAGVCSIVFDLEDAVDDAQSALDCVITALDELARSDQQLRAMVFVRVRTAESIERITTASAGSASVLTGFVVPKFTAACGEQFLAATVQAGRTIGKHLYLMPVLESGSIIYREQRDAELAAVSQLLGAYRDDVLAVRVGATDMCGLFGVRRDRDLTIYDVGFVAQVIADIVNHLGRGDGSGYVITGPVWEYFADHERLFRTLLRTTPFAEQDAVPFREGLVSRDLDGLLRELWLDRANGLHGKTVIHPSHVAAVHALSVVTHEEYGDAKDIVAAGAGGVRRSEYRNKMNEPRPHRLWALQTMRRARVFGVANPGVSFVDLLTALAGR